MHELYFNNSIPIQTFNTVPPLKIAGRLGMTACRKILVVRQLLVPLEFCMDHVLSSMVVKYYGGQLIIYSV